VLDLGCGTGRLAAALTEQGIARVWGVDASAEMLAVAREKLPASVGLKEGRAEQLPFRAAGVGRVVIGLRVRLLASPAGVRWGGGAGGGRPRGRGQVRNRALGTLLAESLLPDDREDRPRALPEPGGARRRAVRRRFAGRARRRAIAAWRADTRDGARAHPRQA